MGAELTQHPEAFKAVVSFVGIYDMIRNELFPNGEYNVSEYGTSRNESDFNWLYAYSPYHNIKQNTSYPAGNRNKRSACRFMAVEEICSGSAGRKHFR